MGGGGFWEMGMVDARIWGRGMGGGGCWDGGVDGEGGPKGDGARIGGQKTNKHVVCAYDCTKEEFLFKDCLLYRVMMFGRTSRALGRRPSQAIGGGGGLEWVLTTAEGRGLHDVSARAWGAKKPLG